MNSPLEFTDSAHYLGSLPKEGQICDFYEIVVDGEIRYIYIRVDPETSPD
ncbi:MAG: hypothetical protein GX956_09190 [Firmicutes bacterium]|nr:hypothetical protein [Bacillota bacterium]